MPTNTNEKVSLDNLNDYQKTLLTRMSYLEIDTKKFDKAQQNGQKITVSDLKHMLSDPNAAYLGDMNVNGSTKMVAGVGTTNIELLEQLEEAGLGDLTIQEVVNDKEYGFQAICFSDSSNNTGFTFRGTDAKNLSSFAQDAYTDMGSFLIDDTKQLSQANALFDKYANKDGNNFLYGHSLGGYLSENVLANNHENVENVFVINPLHINQDKLNTQDKIAAFNDPEKYNCYVTGGDYISPINSPDLFENNINYVPNNGTTRDNIIGNHLTESATIDKNGNFVTKSKEEVYKGYESPVKEKAISLINNNKIKAFFTKTFNLSKKGINSIKKVTNSVKNFVGKARKNIGKNFKKISDKNKSIEKNIKDNLKVPTRTSSFRESLRLENYINGTTYTREDYEKAMKFMQNPMKYMASQKNEKTVEAKTAEQDSFLDR